MATYINTLVNGAGGDLARPTKFRAMFSLLTAGATVPQRDLDLLTKSFSIPPRKMQTLDFKYKGKSVPVMGPIDVEHTISITFIMDDGHRIRGLFEDWLMSLDVNEDGGVNSAITGLKNSLLSNYFGTIGLVIKPLNWEEDTETYSYSFLDIYPTSIGELQYSTDSVSTVQEITIEFAYATYYSAPSGIDLLGLLSSTVNGLIGQATTFLTEGAQSMLDKVAGGLSLDLGFGGTGSSSKAQPPTNDIMSSNYTAPTDNEGE